MAGPCQLASIPAAPEHSADDVGAGLQERRDVVRLVLQALVVAGPARREQLVADALSVQMYLVEPVARDVEPGAGDVAARP